MLTSKQIARIKKEYPRQAPGQIAAQHDLRVADVYGVLGLRGALWGLRLEAFAGWMTCVMIVVAPLIFRSDMSNFADLPQRVFVQTMVTIICVAWLLRCVALRRLEISKNVVLGSALLFGTWSFLSILWSTSWYEAVYAASHWSACALLALVVAGCFQKDVWLQRFAAAVVVSGALVTGIALAQQFAGFAWIPSRSVPSAAFANPNMLSQFLCITLGFTAAAGWFLRRRLLAALCLILVAAGVLVLCYTSCRAAWVAVGCMALWAGILLLRRRWGWKFLVGFCVVVLVLGVGAAAYVESNVQALRRHFDSSARYRLIVWNNGVELAKTRPLLGYGAGSFPFMYGATLNRSEQDKAFDKKKQIRRAHNDYLQAAIELGCPGLLLLLLFTMGSLLMAARLFEPGRPSGEQYIALGCSCALVGFMATCCFSFALQRALPPLLAMLSAALIVVVYCRGTAPVRLAKRAPLVALLVMALLAGVLLLRFNFRNMDSDVFFRQAMAMEKRGANAKALTLALQAVALSPGRMDALTTAGRAYVATGKYDEGIACLQTVVQRQPYNLNAYFILGTGYANSGQNSGALEAFRKVLAIKPDFSEAKKIVSSIKAYGKVRINLR